jgi:2-polyprenyl-3-methyl-5-hydroxy-6-metoxy-1,4-benzoquinol methylase
VASFWHRFGRQTVEKINLDAGQNILDVCCGSGGSAIPAAQAVGPTGHVIAVDLADKLLQLGRSKANSIGLANIEFHWADMLSLGYPDECFDVVVCVFGIFFVPDMVAATKELWRMVRPGGKLAITTWGARLFEPANGVFWNTVQDVRPDLVGKFNPWQRISDRASLTSMLTAANVANIEVIVEPSVSEIGSADDWWTIAMGSGYRGTLQKLDVADFDYVKATNHKILTQLGTKAIETNVLYAVPQKSK